ncbi:MAG: undecaprenyl/decaprenyl-phosphate alpha-N-acetylglucosaminyl 1-phosphate transferase, partial [Staphylococcus epidermidis]|nr:undecaprenyl/decaprenyl-phosphate alpha-N-acetylglucosaminyl 1-phosphate transferase [Staphylococcus epidermidis]MDU1500029.1 undecaprenyl/decaprenyl-phosphate alpha-N-acetylglucosaminyl 1-phosphate transferase [Staphylococcus epidermidis]
FILIVFTIELIVEFTGLIDDNYRPILNLITKKGNGKPHHYDEHHRS